MELLLGPGALVVIFVVIYLVARSADVDVKDRGIETSTELARYATSTVLYGILGILALALLVSFLAQGPMREHVRRGAEERRFQEQLDRSRSETQW